MLAKDLYTGSYFKKSASKAGALKALLAALGIGGLGTLYARNGGLDARVMRSKVDSESVDPLNDESNPKFREHSFEVTIPLFSTATGAANGVISAISAINQGKQFVLDRVSPYAQELASKGSTTIDKLNDYFSSTKPLGNVKKDGGE